MSERGRHAVPGRDRNGVMITVVAGACLLLVAVALLLGNAL